MNRILILLTLAALGCKRPDASLNPAGASTEAPPAYKQQTLDQMQGRWVHTDDSQAIVTIQDHHWIFGYSGHTANAGDSFNIEVTDTSAYTKGNRRATFIVLLNKVDSAELEILTLNDSIMSLMYHPRGNTHVYVRDVEQLKKVMRE